MQFTLTQKFQLGSIVTTAIVFSFLWSMAKYPTHLDVTIYKKFGIISGFLSALTWGLSVLGGNYWNAWFNFFAATLAVLSLGYLTEYPF